MTLSDLIYELMEIKENHGGAVPVQTLGEYDSFHEKLDGVFYREDGVVILTHRNFDDNDFKK